jgi:RHS repeat-associated protein
VANSSGSVIETRGYDAFGKPRDGTWNDLTPAKIASTAVTPKGFTQHEHLNQIELIHMNGRVYDYALGRFTGVDPFIQFPLNSQSLNPYSYILNNPLSGTDPTGYMACNDVSTQEAGSGSCTYNTSDGTEHSADYKVDKNGVSVSTSQSSFNAIAADNALRAANGGAAPKGVTGVGRREQAAAANSKAGPTSIDNNLGGTLSIHNRGINGEEEIPKSVISSCSGYSAPIGAFMAGCPVDRGVKVAAETRVSQSSPVNPNFYNQVVANQSEEKGGIVHTDLSYVGTVDDRLISTAEENWTGDGGTMQLQMTRRPVASLRIDMVNTPEMSRLVNLCSCVRGYDVGGRADIGNGLIHINKDRSLREQRQSLTHELGHYFLGYGHPSRADHFLYGGILDYGSKKVRSFDRNEFYRKYGTDKLR